MLFPGFEMWLLQDTCSWELVPDEWVNLTWISQRKKSVYCWPTGIRVRLVGNIKKKENERCKHWRFICIIKCLHHLCCQSVWQSKSRLWVMPNGWLSHSVNLQIACCYLMIFWRPENSNLLLVLSSYILVSVVPVLCANTSAQKTKYPFIKSSSYCSVLLILGLTLCLCT